MDVEEEIVQTISLRITERKKLRLCTIFECKFVLVRRIYKIQYSDKGPDPIEWSDIVNWKNRIFIAPRWLNYCLSNYHTKMIRIVRKRISGAKFILNSTKNNAIERTIRILYWLIEWNKLHKMNRSTTVVISLFFRLKKLNSICNVPPLLMLFEIYSFKFKKCKKKHNCSPHLEGIDVFLSSSRLYWHLIYYPYLLILVPFPFPLLNFDLNAHWHNDERIRRPHRYVPFGYCYYHDDAPADRRHSLYTQLNVYRFHVNP